MTEERMNELLTVVRQHLAYTWDDPDRDGLLREYIKDGIKYLTRIAGGNELAFDEGSAERRLLKEYVFYANAKQLDLFLPEYLAELNSFQLEQEVIAHVKEQEASTPTP